MEGANKEAEAKILISNKSGRLKFIIITAAILVVVGTVILIYIVRKNNDSSTSGGGANVSQDIIPSNGSAPINVEMIDMKVTATE